MAKEIELKLAIPAQAGELLKQHKVLQQAHSYDSKNLQNIYFDTDDLELNKAKIALRVRKAGDRYIQTLKTSGSGSGGLHQRGEWEWPVKGPRLELDKIDPALWPEQLDTHNLAERIKPVFETNFTRKKWLLSVSHEHLSAEIELVQDLGAAIAGQQQDPISEIELELISGDTDLLFKVAHDLSDELPLIISNISKAVRGFRLIQPEKNYTRQPPIAGFDDIKGLIKAAQHELDHFVLVRDQLAFDRNWANLEGLYESLRQLRWCCYHLKRQRLPQSLYLPSVLTYKLRMLNYALEHMVNAYRQYQTWQRLEQCPEEVRQQADFAVLNTSYHNLMMEPWAGQTLLEIMQWLYMLDTELAEQAPQLTHFCDTEDLFQNLLSRVALPQHPTNKVQWLHQSGPLLHLVRWINYQPDMSSLGIRHLVHESNYLLNTITELGGLMSEELSLRYLHEEGRLTRPELLKRNEEEQYMKVLDLGRQALSFNSLQQNLLTI